MVEQTLTQLPVALAVKPGWQGQRPSTQALLTGQLTPRHGSTELHDKPSALTLKPALHMHR
jgi:hypothetical protein